MDVAGAKPQTCDAKGMKIQGFCSSIFFIYFFFWDFLCIQDAIMSTLSKVYTFLNNKGVHLSMVLLGLMQNDKLGGNFRTAIAKATSQHSVQSKYCNIKK